MDNAYKRKKRWYSFLALLITLLHLIPFYILVTTSLKGIGDFSSKWLFPKTLHLENFRIAWTEAQLGQSFEYSDHYVQFRCIAHYLWISCSLSACKKEHKAE